MTKAQKYLEAIKTFDVWVIVSEWAMKVGEVYPDLLSEANPTTGLGKDPLLERLRKVYS